MTFPVPGPAAAEVRRWALAQGIAVGRRGSPAQAVWEAYHLAHRPVLTWAWGRIAGLGVALTVAGGLAGRRRLTPPPRSRRDGSSRGSS